MAYSTSSGFDFNSSLFIMCVLCASTVLTDTNSFSAISLLPQPFAINGNISNSRLDNTLNGSDAVSYTHL